MVYDKVSFLLYGEDAITNFGVEAARADTTPVPSTMLQLKARYDRWRSHQQAAAQASGPVNLLLSQATGHLSSAHPSSADWSGAGNASHPASHHHTNQYLAAQMAGVQQTKEGLECSIAASSPAFSTLAVPTASQQLQLVSVQIPSTVGYSSACNAEVGLQGSGMLVPGSCGPAVLVEHPSQLLPAASAGYLLMTKPASPGLLVEMAPAPVISSQQKQFDLQPAPVASSALQLQQQHDMLGPHPHISALPVNITSAERCAWAPAMRSAVPATTTGMAMPAVGHYTHLEDLLEQLSTMQLSKGIVEEGRIAATSRGMGGVNTPVSMHQAIGASEQMQQGLLAMQGTGVMHALPPASTGSATITDAYQGWLWAMQPIHAGDVLASAGKVVGVSAFSHY
jgi:hypothetical protein